MTTPNPSTNHATPPVAHEETHEEILCPLCHYNLRGLSEARCPEGGAKFDWAELSDPNRRKHPYLFEHHPQRNVWSFCRTFIGTVWPWTFWSKLLPAQPSNPGRIVLYWLICGMTIPAIVLDVLNRRWISARPGPALQIAVAIAAGAPLFGWLIYVIRVWVATRRYLRFRHALATVISVQIITALLIPASMMIISRLVEWWKS